MSVPSAVQLVTSIRQQLQQLDEEMLSLEQSFGATDPGARNLLHYVALRRHDLRGLQRDLAALGLSSLGRTEGHVRSSIGSVLRILTHLEGLDHPWEADRAAGPSALEGQRLLDRHTQNLLGPPPEGRRVRIMVTMPPEAATDPHLVRRLLESGMNCLRINCAHDGPEAWSAMIRHLREAEAATGRACKVEMDLAGPKLRTGPVEPGPAVLKVRPQRDALGRVVQPALLWLTSLRHPEPAPAACQGRLLFAARWLARLQPGARVRFVDSRGAHRELRIRERAPGGCVGEIHSSSYLTPGLAFTLAAPRGAAAATARLGPLPATAQTLLLRPGDTLQLTRELVPGRNGRRNRDGSRREAHLGVTLPEVLDYLKPGEPVWFDDGKIGGVIISAQPAGATVRITHARPEGDKLAAEKGINLPETDLRIPSLTPEDLAVLPFVAAHADIIGLSFVRSAEDVRDMRRELTRLGRPHLSLMLKIETSRGFENLPLILMEAMRGSPVGVMIARGDLAVECGFERLAEVQEEILWLAEAAFVPVVWATQVLETLAKTGRPSRSEITDAAMGERAECVMLNKGPFVAEAVRALDDILRRMEAHQEKKTARLRQLRVATAFRP
jgi:pyruvate kinase